MSTNLEQEAFDLLQAIVDNSQKSHEALAEEYRAKGLAQAVITGPTVPYMVKGFEQLESAKKLIARRTQAVTAPVAGTAGGMAASIHRDNYNADHAIIVTLREILGLKFGESLTEAVKALHASPNGQCVKEAMPRKAP